MFAEQSGVVSQRVYIFKCSGPEKYGLLYEQLLLTSFETCLQVPLPTRDTDAIQMTSVLLAETDLY